MTAEKIKNKISEICTDFSFEYNGKSCGVDPYSKSEFEMWCGEDLTTVSDISDVMNSPFFDGKTLTEIANKIKVINW